MAEARIVLAAVAGAHGVGGEVRLKLFAEGVASLARHGKVDVGGRGYPLLSVRAAGAGAVARLGGVTDRDAAEALRGSELSVPRAALPPLEEGEYYHADLIGRPCVSPNGAFLGTVSAVENYGAGDLVEIARPDAPPSLVPLRAPAAAIREHDILVDPVFLT